jgi:protein-tyrosine phosphatase
MTFQVLIVCTGNICRSPVAERLLEGRLGSDVSIGSAGTRAMVGSPIAPPMVRLLESVGADAGHFAARQLNERLIRDADLVFALSREHRADIVDLWPAAVRRTFTLLEFARLLPAIDLTALDGDSSAARLIALIPLVAAQRSQTPENDDVGDPYRGSEREYAFAFDQIKSATAPIITAIGADSVRV